MSRERKRIVITGPTGAIGMALIKKCIEQQIAVLAITHKGSKRVDNIPKHPLVDVLEMDLADYGTYEPEETEIYDVFYHLAWNGTFGDTRNDMPLQVKNIQYTLDAVALAKRLGCHTFVGAGSQAEYGRVEGLLRPDTPAFPENGYGMAKLCAGQMSRTVCEQLGMNHIWTRILSVYGPYDGKDTMIMSSLRKMLVNEPTEFTRGEQIWDYLYSEDAAEALLELGVRGISGMTYCLGSGKAYPLSQYIRTMHRLTQCSADIGLGKVPYRDKQVMHLQADISDLQRDIGFEPRTDFEKGIASVIDYMERGLN